MTLISYDTMSNEKDRIVIIVNKTLKDDIDNEIMDRRIKNFQEAYREILKLGFSEFKKRKEKK